MAGPGLFNCTQYTELNREEWHLLLTIRSISLSLHAAMATPHQELMNVQVFCNINIKFNLWKFTAVYCGLVGWAVTYLAPFFTCPKLLECSSSINTSDQAILKMGGPGM